MENKQSLSMLVAVIGLVAIALVMAGQKNEPIKPQMTVTGNSELMVAPDKVEMYVTILTDGEIAVEAQTKNSELSAEVISALKGLGIAEKDIETSNYNLYKKTEWDPKNEKNVDKGYELIHTIKVTTKDIDNTGKYIDAAIQAGANGVERVVFGLTTDSEKIVREQALTKATIAAKEKATGIAKTTEVKLGKISSISESNFYYVPYEFNVRNNIGATKMDAPASADGSIMPQKISVTASIQLTYFIS